MKEKRKNKLKQSIISVIIILVALLAGNIVAEDKIQENTNETVQTNTENNSNINIEEIPQYSGTTVITINNDVPYFEEKDISTTDFEYYSNLDELNRAGVAFANICKFTMPPAGTKSEEEVKLAAKKFVEILSVSTDWNN